jgi:hypothetical protein
MHRRTDLVAHVGQELRFELRCFLVSGDKTVLSLSSFCQISGDFGETEEDIVFVYRCDDDVRPEPGTILAKTPALILTPSIAKSIS